MKKTLCSDVIIDILQMKGGRNELRKKESLKKLRGHRAELGYEARIRFFD